MKNLTSKTWWEKAGTRAIRTMAQAGISFIGTSALLLSDVNWMHVGSAMVLSGVLSLLMSLAGLPEIDENSNENTNEVI